VTARKDNPMGGAIPKPRKGHLNVLYFASASTFTMKEYEAIPAPMPLGKLFAALEERHPGIKARILDSCLVTVNLDYVDVPAAAAPGSNGDAGSEQMMLNEGDEVAIIPPVSSG
jgi:molybdopterin synthase sulfur carrier subunit